MPQAKGSTSKAMIGAEATFKAVPSEGFIIPFNSCGLKPSRAKNTAKTIRGDLNPVEPFNGNLSISGSMVVPCDSLALWYMLQLALGDPVTTGAGPYVHIFKLGNTRPSFTLEEYFPELAGSKYVRYVGCKISKLSISLGGDGELTVNFDIVAADYSIEAASFDADPTVLTISRLSNSHLAITENATGMSTCTGVDITIDFGLDTSQYVIGGGGVLGEIPDGVASVTGSLKALFDSSTLLQKALDSTESSITATLTNGASSILALKVCELQYSEDVPAIDGPQGLQSNLGYAGYYTDATEETAFQVTLTNTDEHP